MAASPSPGSDSDDPFAIGSILDDRYRIEAVLGTGGMGRVYRAEHTKIGKSVAIKVLHADLTRNREASQRFQREAIASGRLHHPNIVGVSDFGMLDSGTCYLVMEVLEGESLGDRLARDRRIHWVEALDILRGVLNGLRHAHERGVVHRDIKPDNVYLAHKDGELVVKILDFGIAKLFAGTADDPASTRAGLTVGTPAYLSPEQAVGGSITPASDLYSASIVLYEMLAGRAPFEDKDPLAMLGAQVSRPPPPLADTAPGVDVPAPLEDILQRGLRKVAAERISTADDYLALIDAFSPPLPPAPRSATSSVLEVAADGSAPSTVLSGARSGAPAGTATPLPAASAAPASRPAAAGRASGRAATADPRATPDPRDVGRSLPHALLAGAVSVEMAQLPRAARAVSLADVNEPIPLTWIVRSGVVIGLVIIAAIALAIGARCRGSDSTTQPASAAGSSAASGSAAKPDSSAGPSSPSTSPASDTPKSESTKPAVAPSSPPADSPPPPKPAAPARPTPPQKPPGKPHRR